MKHSFWLVFVILFATLTACNQDQNLHNTLVIDGEEMPLVSANFQDFIPLNVSPDDTHWVRRYWIYDGQATFKFNVLDECYDCNRYVVLQLFSSGMDGFQFGTFRLHDGETMEAGTNYAQLYVYDMPVEIGGLVSNPTLKYVPTNQGKVVVGGTDEFVKISLDVNLQEYTRLGDIEDYGAVVKAIGRFQGSPEDTTEEL